MQVLLSEWEFDVTAWTRKHACATWASNNIPIWDLSQLFCLTQKLARWSWVRGWRLRNAHASETYQLAIFLVRKDIREQTLRYISSPYCRSVPNSLVLSALTLERLGRVCRISAYLLSSAITPLGRTKGSNHPDSCWDSGTCRFSSTWFNPVKEKFSSAGHRPAPVSMWSAVILGWWRQSRMCTKRHQDAYGVSNVQEVLCPSAPDSYGKQPQHVGYPFVHEGYSLWLYYHVHTKVTHW